MTESLAELKTTQEEQADLVRRYVDEYAALALEADRIKQRMDWLKGQFETLATGALKDTKLLSISYWGSQNSRVTVTNTATVKPFDSMFTTRFSPITARPMRPISAFFKIIPPLIQTKSKPSTSGFDLERKNNAGGRCGRPWAAT